VTPTELTAARESLHLSQVELARVLGIHPTILNRWEHGRAKIPPYMTYTLLGVKQFLGIISGKIG
jgi:DNA-binding transcriptional regulator YiaG